MITVSQRWLLLAVSILTACRADTQPVPIKALFKGYSYNQMFLSPDGERLATIFPHNQEHDTMSLGLAVSEFSTGKSRILHREDGVSVIDLDWIDDTRVLTTLFGGYARDGIYAVNMATGALKDIADPMVDSLMHGARILTTVTGKPDEVLMVRHKIADRDEKRGWRYDGRAPLPGVYRLNVATGAHELAVRDPGWTEDWFADLKGVPRVAVGFDRAAFKPDGRLVNPREIPRRVAFWLDDNGSSYPLPGVECSMENAFEPLGFDPEGRLFLFAARQGRDCAAVYGYNAESRTIEGPIVQDDTVDIQEAVLSPHNRTVAGVWIRNGKSRVEWLDPRLKAIQAEVDKALPQTTNSFTGWGRDYRRLLVLSSSGSEPGRYFLYERDKGLLSEMYRRADWIKTTALGRTEPFDFAARDGLKLHGYFTRPPDAVSGQALPMVLYIHGGPWLVRDLDGYDPVVQFFATRGYGVLQVNYRGSQGYGRRHFEMAKRQFGGAMQDDLEDAVNWAVAQGYVDPARMVVAGGSYGGYASLMSLIRQPDRFRAGVSMFPVSDLVAQINDYDDTEYQIPGSEQANEWWKKWVGDPVKDKAKLEAASPINNLSKLKAPVFVVYGDYDPRIQYHQSIKLVRSLRAAKKTYVRVAPPREGHGLYHETNRIEVFEELEKFLAKYAPVR